MVSNAELLEHASALVDMGKISEAHGLVKQALENDNRDAEAWYALVQVAENDAERRKAIYQLWSIDPNHPEANYLLDKLKAGTLPPIGTQTSLGSRKVKFSDDYRGKAYYTKDYMMPAIVTMLAYWFIWFVGLGFNLYFLNEARRLEQETGIRQENVGCLKALAGFYIGLPLVVLVFVFVIILFSHA